jgi:hypothetical protein
MNVCTGALPAIGIGHDRLDRGEKSLKKISSLSGGGISCGRAIPCWTEEQEASAFQCASVCFLLLRAEGEDWKPVLFLARDVAKETSRT